MQVLRTLIATAIAAATVTASPASAQFFLKSPNLAGPRSTGLEPGILGSALPGATPVEIRAAMVWNIRAALNVAALQCQFEPTLLTIPTYNAMLRDHGTELDKAYDTLTAYFMRTGKTKKLGQQALDQFGTRVYSGYSTIGAQYTFCQTAHSIGQQIMFTPRGGVGEVAEQRMRELRNSLVLAGEQQFPRYYYMHLPETPPFGIEKCWRKNVYEPRRCKR